MPEISKTKRKMGETEFDFRPLLFIWWGSMLVHRLAYNSDGTLQTNYTRPSFCRTAAGHA